MNISASGLYLRQIVVKLQAQPKARCAAYRFFEPHRHFCGHSRPAVDKPRQRCTRHAQRFRAVSHTHAQFVEAIPDKVAGLVGIFIGISVLLCSGVPLNP
jgi:hypothetical protein